MRALRYAGISRRLQYTHLGPDDSNTCTSISLRLGWQFIRDTPASRVKQKYFDTSACLFTMLFTNYPHWAPWLRLCRLSGYTYYYNTLPCLPLYRPFLVTRKSTGTNPLPSDCNIKSIDSAVGIRNYT